MFMIMRSITHPFVALTSAPAAIKTFTTSA